MPNLRPTRHNVATLRTKTLIILATTLAGLLLIAYIPLRLIVLESFITLEQQSVRQNVERAANALEDDLATLERTTSDYANWDDTYAFVADGNREYLTQNYTDETFVNNRLSLVVIVDPAGQTLFAQGFDLNTGQAASAPQALQTFGSPDHPLLHHADERSSSKGVVVLPEGPLLVAARPILTSNYTGPPRGTLIMGRALDAAEVRRLADTTRLSLSIHRLEDPALPADIQVARAHLTPAEPAEVRALDEQVIAGYLLIADTYGAPALVARIESARGIYQQGQAGILYFGLSLLAAGLVFGLVVLALFSRLVLSRLARLDTGVRAIGEHGDQSERVLVEGADELGRLASGINGMLETLDLAQSQLRQADAERARLQEEFVRAREQMFQMAIHDLKNPLTAITGFLHVLQTTKLTSEQHELLAGASESTTRMTHLAATFLDVARMQEGRLTIHREPCDIAALLRECGQELGIWAIRDQKQITFAIDDDLPALFVDVGLMRRIILNLLSNAIKHTPLGTPIPLGAEIAGDEARLFVRDGGEGIPPELQSQIFDRFSASTRTQEYQSSTGLGLTFCKLAVESHGGMIELCSLLEAGTTFVVRLPLEMNLLPASAH